MSQIIDSDGAGWYIPRADTPLGPIGVALNGVALLNPSAGSGNPSGKAAPPTGYNYNAGSPDTLFGEDTAGGHPNQQGQYHYHAFSFGESWTDTAVGGTVVDATKIAYLGGSLTHADGHSKILGFAFDVSRGDDCVIGSASVLQRFLAVLVEVACQ